MGIVPKIIELKGIDPETAFNDAQAEARHVYGNSKQTGTLADAEGCIVVSGPALLPWDGRRTAQQMLRDGHAKAAGPVFLLRLGDAAKSKTVKAVVDITNLSAGQVDDTIDAAIREKLPDDTWGIVSVEARDEDAEGPERKGTRKTKIILTTGRGAKKTRYSVRHAATNKELITHDSLAAARVWMKDALAAGAAPMTCVGEFVKESGPLLSGESQVLKHTIAITATIGTVAPGGNGTYLATGIFPTPGE
jgi:hypothetical protein